MCSLVERTNEIKSITKCWAERIATTRIQKEKKNNPKMVFIFGSRVKSETTKKKKKRKEEIEIYARHGIERRLPAALRLSWRAIVWLCVS